MRGDRYLIKDEEILTAWRELSEEKRLVLLKGLRPLGAIFFDRSDIEALSRAGYLNSRCFSKGNRLAIGASWHKYAIIPRRGRWKRRAGFSAAY